MLSVTQCVRRIIQPFGGYLPSDAFTVREYHDGKILNDSDESLSAFRWMQGTVVDYLTRMLCGVPVEKAFQVSLLGAAAVNELGNAIVLAKSINGLDQTSIRNACKLVRYDVAFRSSPMQYAGSDEAAVPNYLIDNIAILVERGVAFIK